MAMPPVLLIACFAGLPIALAFGYSLGHGGGLNSTTALIAQHQFLVEDGWGTTAASREVFSSERFREDLWVTVSVTVVATAIVLVLAKAIALFLRLRGGILARSLSVLAVVPRFILRVPVREEIREIQQRLGASQHPGLGCRHRGAARGCSDQRAGRHW